MFSRSEHSINNFISQTIMSSVSADGLFRDTCREDETPIDRVIMSFANSSIFSFIRLKERFQKIVSSRKKPAEKVIFYILGYRHISSPRGSENRIDTEQKRFDKLSDAHRNLYQLKSSSHRYTEWW